jgi:hypothetical protein
MHLSSHRATATARIDNGIDIILVVTARSRGRRRRGTRRPDASRAPRPTKDYRTKPANVGPSNGPRCALTAGNGCDGSDAPTTPKTVLATALETFRRLDARPRDPTGWRRNCGCRVSETAARTVPGTLAGPTAQRARSSSSPAGPHRHRSLPTAYLRLPGLSPRTGTAPTRSLASPPATDCVILQHRRPPAAVRCAPSPGRRGPIGQGRRPRCRRIVGTR